MMGHHACPEALFYYFLLEDQVPENHLLRLIDQHISFGFVQEQQKDNYSESGHLAWRILLLSNVSTTSDYIKSTPTMSRKQWLSSKAPAKTEDQNLRDTNGTVKPDSAATAEFVN